MLNNHVMGLRALRRRDDHRRALIGQLTVQSDFLSRMTDLSIASEQNVQELSSRSIPVMVAARQNHIEMMAYMQRPWWHKLHDNSDLNALEPSLPPSILGKQNF